MTAATFVISAGFAGAADVAVRFKCGACFA